MEEDGQKHVHGPTTQEGEPSVVTTSTHAMIPALVRDGLH